MKELTLEEWMAERPNHIGGSEVAAILGVDPNYGALSVFEKKVTGYSMDDNKVLKYGRLMEEPIASMYADETGRKVVNPGSTLYQYHPKYPWLAATLDREQWGSEEYPAPEGCEGKGALEIKNIDIPGMSPDDWNPNNDEIFKFVIQCQIQAACAGLEWCSLAGKFPYYDVEWFDMIRNDEMLEAIYPILEEFWKCVQTRTPPPVDILPETLNVCRRLWKKEEGTTIPLDKEDMDLINEWEREKHKRTKADSKAKQLETRIRYKMKSHTFGTLPDGTLISLKTTKKKGHIVPPSECRTLRRSRPKGI